MHFSVLTFVRIAYIIEAEQGATPQKKGQKKMIKEMIKELNIAMHNGSISFDVVKKLCEQLSKLTGKNYSIINRRVVYIEYGKYHDAWANA